MKVFIEICYGVENVFIISLHLWCSYCLMVLTEDSKKKKSSYNSSLPIEVSEKLFSAFQLDYASLTQVEIQVSYL